MKAYIVGSVASGKTTLARKLSKILGIPCTHLDGVVHIKDNKNKEWGNVRRTDEEINKMFLNLINKPQWIIEDSGRKIFDKGLEEANVIIYLKPSKFIRKKRIILRYFKQKLGLEDCLYTPSLHMLKFMFRALDNYEKGIDDLELRINQYKHKVINITNSMEMNEYISSMIEH